ncbi:hypothetical protein BpHYR1_023592 [Brachionus plicatilis]|uniref:Uncharacterized protein n=1 Tax=Brachionus plicatilis TaxID=10195 RepID=A0A3M7P3R7_BRAPC|nr:hypothetical protein BpHYR1_023592 [Brachionus plicatilis]
MIMRTVVISRQKYRLTLFRNSTLIKDLGKNNQLNAWIHYIINLLIDTFLKNFVDNYFPFFNLNRPKFLVDGLKLVRYSKYDMRAVLLKVAEIAGQCSNLCSIRQNDASFFCNVYTV